MRCKAIALVMFSRQNTN